MEIPWTELKPETLRAVIEEFISRNGTDYGANEVPLEVSVEQVHVLLRTKKARIVFDSESQSCDIREAP